MDESRPERMLDEDYAIDVNDYLDNLLGEHGLSKGEGSYGEALKRAKKLSKHLSKQSLPKAVRESDVDEESLWQFIDEAGDVNDVDAMMRVIMQRAGLNDADTANNADTAVDENDQTADSEPTSASAEQIEQDTQGEQSN